MEKDTGKAFDLYLFKRVLAFTRPYRKTFLGTAPTIGILRAGSDLIAEPKSIQPDCTYHWEVAPTEVPGGKVCPTKRITWSDWETLSRSGPQSGTAVEQ